MSKEHPIAAIMRKNKSPGFCPNCNPYFYQLDDWGHKPKNCRNTLYCDYHSVEGHVPTLKCTQLCSYCRNFGHSMPFCHKLKNCDLCGRYGHNPYRCWRYSTLTAWAERAKVLNRCMQCLTLCTTDKNCIDKDGDPDYHCPNCRAWRTYWNPAPQFVHVNGNCKGSQTETDDNTEQKSKTELLQSQAIINNKDLQINELSNKVLDLENKLANSISENKELKLELKKCITHEQQLALQKVQKLELACNEKDVELKNACSTIEKLKADIEHTHLQLEQYKHVSVQLSKVTPVITPKDTTRAEEQPRKVCETFMPNKLQQPCSPQVASSQSDYSELNHIKSTLENLQTQQQKIAMIVSHLYYENRIQVPDTTNSFKDYYPSFNFNPYMGLLDTGQYFNKLH